MDAFTARKNKPPELGWVLPSGELVTEIDAPVVSVLMAKSGVRFMSRVGVIPAEAAVSYVSQHQVDCDQASSDKPVPLYRYAAKGFDSKPAAKGDTNHAVQVLVFAGRVDSGMVAGAEDYSPTEAQAAAVWKAMGAQPGQKRRMAVMRQRGGAVFYTQAATYAADGTENRSGKFLQNATGKILGQVIEEINEDNRCDGCGVATYDDGPRAVFLAENLISIPQLPYPMVLEDSSTVEGRAIDLFTFSANGETSMYRKYEYVVTSVFGPDPGVTPPKPTQ